MRQYTRVYMGAGNQILHMHTQTTPITIEPVSDPNVVRSEDIEVDTPSGYVRAKELLDNMEVRNGRAEFLVDGRVDLKDLPIGRP